MRHYELHGSSLVWTIEQRGSTIVDGYLNLHGTQALETTILPSEASAAAEYAARIRQHVDRGFYRTDIDEHDRTCDTDVREAGLVAPAAGPLICNHDRSGLAAIHPREQLRAHLTAAEARRYRALEFNGFAQVDIASVVAQEHFVHVTAISIRDCHGPISAHVAGLLARGAPNLESLTVRAHAVDLNAAGFANLTRLDVEGRLDGLPPQAPLQFLCLHTWISTSHTHSVDAMTKRALADLIELSIVLGQSTPPPTSSVDWDRLLSRANTPQLRRLRVRGAGDMSDVRPAIARSDLSERLDHLEFGGKVSPAAAMIFSQHGREIRRIPERRFEVRGLAKKLRRAFTRLDSATR